MITRRAALAVLPLALSLAGCGFELRTPPHYEFKTIRLAMPAGPFLESISRQLNATGQVVVVSDPQKADVTLVSDGDKRTRTVLSLTSTGQVREFQLLLHFSFQLNGPDGRVLLPPTDIMRRINESYSDTAALSKESEAQMLFESMQDDVVQQVMRRLAMIHPGALAPAK